MLPDAPLADTELDDRRTCTGDIDGGFLSLSTVVVYGDGRPTSWVPSTATTKEDAVGRTKAKKPRKPHGETPRIVDMADVPVATKKNVVLTYIMSAEDPTWSMIEAGVRRKYGEFTVAERDLLDLPAQARTEALNDLAFYASAQLPPQAVMGAQEAAARTAANCRQALHRLLPVAGHE